MVDGHYAASKAWTENAAMFGESRSRAGDRRVTYGDESAGVATRAAAARSTSPPSPLHGRPASVRPNRPLAGRATSPQCSVIVMIIELPQEPAAIQAVEPDACRSGRQPGSPEPRAPRRWWIGR